MVWHHCHECGRFVAWLCDDCNTTLTRHAIKNWDRIWRSHTHDCHPPPQLFQPCEPPPRNDDRNTRSLYLSNGGGDDRYIRISTVDGYVSVEQLAGICGVNANSARDLISGRKGRPATGTQKDGTWFVGYAEVLALLEKRWGLTDT